MKNKKRILLGLIALIAIAFGAFGGWSYWQANKPIDIGHPQKGDFVKVGQMSAPRSQHEAILLDDGTVLIFGGMTIRKNYEGGSNTAEIYNPITMKFTPVGNMLDARIGATATKLTDGRILRTGGRSNNSFKGTQFYNYVTEIFEKGPDMLFQRENHTATLLKSGKVLIVGGKHGFDKSEIYNPVKNKFEIAPKLNIPRFEHSAILLKDGRVLIIGGLGNYKNGKFSILKATEIYNPKTNKFALVGNMNIARRKPYVFTLSNGNVIISGGLGEGHGDTIYLKSIEMYNPKTNEFKIMADHDSIAGMPAEVLLKNDNILITGGCTGVGLSLICKKTSEIYNPETNKFTKGKDMNFIRSGHVETLLKDGKVITPLPILIIRVVLLVLHIKIRLQVKLLLHTEELKELGLGKGLKMLMIILFLVFLSTQMH